MAKSGRIVKALNSSNCLIEDRDEIRILKNTDYQDYKKDSTILSSEAESLNDFLFILDKLNIEIPRYRYKLNKFKEYLNTIKY